VEAGWVSPLSRRFLIKFDNKAALSWSAGTEPPCYIIRPHFIPSEKVPTALPGPCVLSLSSSATSLEEAVLTKLSAGGQLL